MAPSKAGSWLASHKKLTWCVVIIMLLMLWWWRGDLQQAQTNVPPVRPGNETRDAFVVQAKVIKAQPYQENMVVQGKLIPIYSVTMRAQVSGTVQQREQLGQSVSHDQVLITLSDEGRSASLKQAQADLALRQAEASAGARLRAKQHISQTQLLTLKAEAAAAQATLTNAQLALKHSQIRAPFAAKIDNLAVEVGDFVQVGEELLTLVDTRRLKLNASVSSQEVTKLSEGLPVRVRLLDGRELQGKLGFIAQAADEQTRSFALEAEIDNPLGWRVAGASAGLHISLPIEEAMRLSPALLALNDLSQLGVYILDEQDRMHWQQVELLSITPEAAWVSGLGTQARVVTRGADFVTTDTPLKVKMLEEATPVKNTAPLASPEEPRP
ncbi:efflux RND transporter periplasmic adaptor subunit [Oceanisphaera avium]|uniref:Multidrug resistance protein MdtA-like barrel-sandwich hybrid domain-containing protein n=1 Tax=Oceanisphaera avium TaxID=1903694 RepID=A0A1Y0CW20_9GAMM|nr:efflux RND transporter periplasmic adaptor subunit [Oceanisphaera avium]ART79097.1 hypothetical protein CBP12_02175 [Oceanisphaera avium]